MHRIRIIRSLHICTLLWMVRSLRLCLCLCVSAGIKDTPGRGSLCLGDLRCGEIMQRRERRRKTRRSQGLLLAPGQLYSSGRPSETGVPRWTRCNHAENRERRPWMPSTCTYAAYTDATLHMHTLTQHPPDTNKLEKPPQAKTSEQNASHMLTSIIMLHSVPHSHHQLLSVAWASAWGLSNRRWRREEEEEDQLGYAASHAGQTSCPLLSSAALTLH